MIHIRTLYTDVDQSIREHSPQVAAAVKAQRLHNSSALQPGFIFLFHKGVLLAAQCCFVHAAAGRGGFHPRPVPIPSPIPLPHKKLQQRGLRSHINGGSRRLRHTAQRVAAAGQPTPLSYAAPSLAAAPLPAPLSKERPVGHEHAVGDAGGKGVGRAPEARIPSPLPGAETGRCCRGGPSSISGAGHARIAPSHMCTGPLPECEAPCVF